MPGEPKPTLYDALRLPRNASMEEVRAAYRRLAREHHPDRAGANGETMARINQAYGVLSNPERRARYDHALTAPPPPPRKPGRVVLPGDRERARMLRRAATGVTFIVLAGLALMAGVKARATAAADDLRLVPSRSMVSVAAERPASVTTAPSR
jgi:curved DNA-binding protein CbpA